MNRNMAWLAGALFTWGIGESMFILFQPIYLQQLGADPIQIGAVLGVFGAAMTLTPIPAGYLSDRFGRRPMLIVGWGIGVVATVLMALASHLAVFIVGLALYGVTAFVVSPLDSYTTAARGNWSVGRAITALSIAFNGGAIVGPMIGGWIGDHYGIRTIYMVAAGVFVVSTVLMWFIAPQPRDHHDPENPPQALMRNRRYLGFLAIYFAVSFATFVPQQFTPNLLRNERGLSLELIGQLGSVGYLGNTLLNFLLGQLEARTGFLLGQLGVAAFTVLLWRGNSFGWFALGYLLLGGYRALRMLGVAQVRPFVHESQMGLAYGIAETVGLATLLLVPLLSGYLYARDPTLMYPVGLGMIAVGLVLTLIFVPHSGKLPPDHMELASER